MDLFLFTYDVVTELKIAVNWAPACFRTFEWISDTNSLQTINPR